MILAQVWRQQLWRGLSAALIVPGTLLAALVVLAFAGGFGGLGALTQTFSGPAIPVGASGSVSPRSGAAAQRTLLASPAAPARRAPVHAATVPVGGRLSASAGSRSVTRTAPGGSSPGGSPRGGPSPAPPASSAAGPPSAQPTPTATDELVGTATAVTSQLPSPAASAATQALQSAGSAIDRVAPLPPPGGAAGPAAPPLP